MPTNNKPELVDLRQAVVLTAAGEADAIERQASLVLRTEIKRRTGLVWSETSEMPAQGPVVVLGSRERMPALPQGLRLPDPPLKDGAPAAEGFVLSVDTTSRPRPTVCLIGNDHRAVLFAVGRLLRMLEWRQGEAALPADCAISTAPAYPMRGIQLGYRRLNDTCDAWDVGRFTQYIRDLIFFGNNAIELIPPVSPGNVGMAEVDPLMPMTPWDMNVALCAVLDAYDMDVWFWLPLETGAAEDPEHRACSLRERELLFAACQRIDAVFVPGGDPGDTDPDLLMPYLQDLTVLLRRHHPQAEMWVSPQKFRGDQLERFFTYLERESPDWLAGIVWGPGCLITLPETRERVPRRYPIRHYPDVTHAKVCQFPYPYWDDVWSQAYERQPIHPRPTQYAHITNYHAPYTPGSIAYSDGTGDDVNKVITLERLWDPEADVRETLRQYGRCFCGADFAEGVADGLLMLEQNWAEPAASSPQVPRTLAHWQEMERRAGDWQRGSWRFQQGLIRAYGDAYVQRRVQQEQKALAAAYAALNQDHLSVKQAISDAEKALAAANPLTAAPDLRQRTHELADDLFQSIGMQLSLERHGSSDRARGAMLDNNDAPLTDAAWLRGELGRIKTLESEAAQREAIQRVLHWTDAGEGGFYDDLGNRANGTDPHLVREKLWDQDPSFLRSVQDSHYGPGFPERHRHSWAYQAHVYRSPLKMRYEGLDPQACYLLRAVYAGRGRMTLQLVLGGQPVGEPVSFTGLEPVIREFEVPPAAVADGTLDVRWENVHGYDAQIAEVWLVRKAHEKRESGK